MVKGCQKNMVVLKRTGSPLIEEAYFILRERADSGNDASDIISEANRILEENVGLPCRAFSQRKEKRKKWIERIIYTVVGVAIGVLLAVTL